MSDRHEQFAGKNAALGKVWASSQPPKSTKEKTTAPRKCDKCGEVKPLRSFRSAQNDRTEGVASYGFQIKHLCEACAPAAKVVKEEPKLSDKAIKSLLKGARRSL